MTTINKLSTFTIFALLALSGCGGGSSTTGANAGKSPTVDVSYTLHGKTRPTCHNATTTGELNPTPIDYVICNWNCGRYQGSDTISVRLIFKKVPETEEGIWELYQENITEAYPAICKDI